uniref:Uncharacterized protein n=1 Tax=Nelumbo nucifera TaxID=4432 RepID=A0A822YJR3_NELNU|nr:TPA_asm: hypothetical protein HUJ06_011204 [Nelumbo nucifera]
MFAEAVKWWWLFVVKALVGRGFPTVVAPRPQWSMGSHAFSLLGMLVFGVDSWKVVCGFSPRPTVDGN